MQCSRLAVLLTAVSLSTYAQTPDPTPAPVDPGWCVPFFHCDGDWIGDIDRTSEGWHLYWAWRSFNNNKRYINMAISCKHGTCDIGRFVNSFTGFKADAAGGIQGVRTALQQLSPLDCTQYQTLCEEQSTRKLDIDMKSALLLPSYGPIPSPEPPPEAYKVKANPLSTATPPTRPAFTLTCNTENVCVRGTKEAARAVVDTTCFPDKPKLASGSVDFWMEYDPAKPGIVALCSKVQQ